MYSKFALKYFNLIENVNELTNDKSAVNTSSQSKIKKLNISKKCNVSINLTKIKLVPTKFSLDISFLITFNSSEIRLKFKKSNTPSDDTESSIDAKILKTMKSKPSKMISVATNEINYNKFYTDVIKKQLSSEAIDLLIKNNIKSGTLNMQDFIVSKSKYLTITDTQLWNTYKNKDRKNFKASPIKLNFGYKIEFSAKNELKMYNEKNASDLSEAFIEMFENAALKQTKYYGVSKQ